MPLAGNIPTGASPASRFGERLRAGRIALTNSSHGDDHSTSSRGASLTLALASAISGSTSFTTWNILLMLLVTQNFQNLCQSRRPGPSPSVLLCLEAIQEHLPRAGEPAPPARVSRLLQDALRSSWNQDKQRQSQIASLTYEPLGTA